MWFAYGTRKPKSFHLRSKERRCIQGFTLVELIIVIVLVSILSVVAASRFIGASNFSAYTAQEQAISVIRQVQISRMQSNLVNPVSNSHYVLTITSDCVGSVTGCSASNDELRSDRVQESGVNFYSSPALNTIAFDLLGNPLGSASSGVTITIQSNGNTTQVCINEQGYVHRGGC
ncbi:prepilin-type N-terminal cleavage/methylation domain-containing protein [Vibrio sp. CAIM 722]|uniref:Prepilin-type N-terminal cleavage/methylation domain-containing protein n=1 Tax=Vibrio eleionomae TaxID=2653505 RepID=A0A7X4LIT2_9VIBR|nr:prepilin-type N-terminal cleavage/methylation domain-containing protein [Vibrio eleionomae]